MNSLYNNDKLTKQKIIENNASKEMIEYKFKIPYWVKIPTVTLSVKTECSGVQTPEHEYCKVALLP